MKRSLLFSIVRCLLCSILAAGLRGGAGTVQAASEKPETAAPAADERLVKAKPGPWGQIEYSYFYLEAPQHLLDTVQAPNSTPRWVFSDTKPEALRTLFVRAKMPADMQVRLLDPKKSLIANGQLTLFPSTDDLEAMTPEMRAVIYPEVAKSPANEFYQYPIYFTGDGVEEWLRDSKLRPELQDIIRKMSYPHGRVQAFSNIAVLLSHAQSDAEARRIVKVTTRVRCLIAHLRIEPGDDIKALAAYWTARDAESDILPLLESAGERAGAMAELDLMHLLPPLARRLLYTYPGLESAREGRMPDCHWTTLNFFNKTPQQYYRDTRLASQHVIESYRRVEPPYRLGDALMFMNSAGDVIHSCVYVADDIVFTKNGENLLQPWVLKKLNGVKQIYLQSDAWHVQGFRLKDGA